MRDARTPVVGFSAYKSVLVERLIHKKAPRRKNRLSANGVLKIIQYRLYVQMDDV